MRIDEIMTRDAVIVQADASLREAARAMLEIDSGVLPVADGENIIGVITDRDIALRGVAQGKGPDAAVREAMSGDVKFCFEDEELESVGDQMATLQLRRLPVMSRQMRLLGMVSIGDIAQRASAASGEALRGVARKSAQHNQSAATEWESKDGPYNKM